MTNVAGYEDALREYLMQPGLSRLWQAVHEKYDQLGRVGGRVTLRHVEDDERDAIAGLLAENLHGQSEIVIRLDTLDLALQATRFQVSLAAVMDLLFSPDGSNRHIRWQEEQDWAQFLAWSKGVAGDVSALAIWMAQLAHGVGPGYRAYRDCFQEFREQDGHSPSWQAAMTALAPLPAQAVRLPIWAAQTTGDAHGLDRDRLAGRMFYWGICARFEAAESNVGENLPSEDAVGADELRRQYARAGLLVDDISSVVWVAGWNEIAVAPMAVPLRTLEGLAEMMTAAPPHVFILENPSVFGAVLDRLDRMGLTGTCAVVCTSGQPSMAGLRLLDIAQAHGAVMHYSGDFDVQGLQIARNLLERYPQSMVTFGMDADTYLRGVHEHAPEFSARELTQLEAIGMAWDDRLLPQMLRTRRKVFQEHVLDHLFALMT